MTAASPTARATTALIITNLSESLLAARGDLIAALRERGVEVHCTGPDLVGEVAERLVAMGCVCHDLPMSRTRVAPTDDLRYLASLHALMRRHRFDVVMAYNIKPVVFGMAAAAAAGVPSRVALITGLGFSFIERPGPLRAPLQQVSRAMFRAGMRLATRLVFQNPDDEALLRERFAIPPAKIGRVDGSGVNLERFAHAPPASDELVFLTIARLLVSKGVDELVAAARIVKQAHPEVRFQLIGWHDDHNPAAIDRAALERAVDDGVIEFLGRQADVIPALRACSVFVLPSYREGTPRSVLEALAVGRAVITTDTAGCRQTVIDGESGFLVPVRAVAELAAAMMRFVERPGLVAAMGLRSRRLAEEVFDVRKVNAAMLAELGVAPAPSSASAPGLASALGDELAIRPATAADIGGIVQIHLAAFPGFFLTELGAGFLRQMYRGFLADPGGVFLVAGPPVAIAGFATGTVRPGGQDTRIARSRAPLLAWHALPAVAAHPLRVSRRMVARLRGADGTPPLPNDAALLRSIAIDPARRGSSLATALLAAFEREVAARGAARVCLTTDAEHNERVNRFYARAGYAVEARFVQHGARPMNLYSRPLPVAAGRSAR